ncbi:hypothetical protein ACFWFF_11470 [Streptomyces sp. NPDC060223]|uniref:hypothetical protein n=1 Tax=unclassified Streptomyces TaxID=2593676 RepID=UPI00362AA7C6
MNYTCVSRRYTANEIDPVIRAAIDAHTEAHQLGEMIEEMDSAAPHCCETISVRLKTPGLLSRFFVPVAPDPDTEHRTVVVITSGYLVVVTSGEKRGVHVSSTRLDGISLVDPSRRFLAAGAPAGRAASGPSAPRFGVVVSGLWWGFRPVAILASKYIGLGDDPEGRDFLDQLHSAVAAAKKV